MNEPVTCLACGMTGPPPEMTCTGGAEGSLRDHFVGTDRGCHGCGRLAEACAMRPCQEVRAAWHAIEDGSDG